MENMSRVKKYKNLRDSINNGDVDSTDYTDEILQDDNEEDTFDFPEIKFDDDFSFSSDDLSEEKQREALSRVKENAGEGVTFNTRLDILNQIMGLNQQTTPSKKVAGPAKKERDEDFHDSISDIIKAEKANVEKEEPEKEEPEKEVVLEKDEPSKIEKVEKLNDDESILGQKILSFASDEDDEEDEEYDEKKSGLFEKMLTFIIVVLSIALFALIGYIIKLFFS